jgi:hypothetical protein
MLILYVIKGIGPQPLVCVCPASFTGVYCQTKLVACDSSPCLNGGRCSEPVIGQFSCNCTGTGFFGTTCNSGKKKHIIQLLYKILILISIIIKQRK